MFSTARLAKVLTECIASKLMTKEIENPLENPDQRERPAERDLLDAFEKVQNIWKFITEGSCCPLESYHTRQKKENNPFEAEKGASDQGLDTQSDSQMQVDEQEIIQTVDPIVEKSSSTTLLEDFISTSQQLLYLCSQFEEEYSVIVEREIIGITGLLSAIQLELDDHLKNLSDVDLPHYIPTEVEMDLINAIQMQFYHDKAFHEYFKISSSSLLSSTGALGISPRLVGSSQPYALFEGLLLRLPLENLITVQDDAIEADSNQYNLNAKGLIIYKAHDTIYQAISTILLGDEKGAELLQLSVFYKMMTDNNTSAYCQKNNIPVHNLRINILSGSDCPEPNTLNYVSQTIGKSIVLHIGSFDPSTLSYRFGNQTNQEINVLELDHKYYSLVTQTFQQYSPSVFIRSFQTPPRERKLSVPCSSNISFGEFGNDMKVFFEKCTFCVEFGVPKCHHLNQEHADALKRISITLQNNCYGSVNASSVLEQDLDIEVTNQLPNDLKADFVVVKTPGMNDCFYNSVSYALTGSFTMALPLRRGVATEVKGMEMFYKNCYEDMGYTDKEISKFLQQAYSYDSWGNLDTANVMSKIILRKIIIHRIPDPHDAPGTQYGHTTLNLGYFGSKTYQPVYLLLKHNHFSTLIPHNSADPRILTGPVGKDKLFVFMHKTLKAMILDLPHNYCDMQNEISRQDSSLHPFLLSITPGKFDEFILEKIKFRDTGWTNAQTEDYKLFANVILPELILIKSMAPLEDYIYTFVHRTTFDSFWREGIVKVKPWYGDSRGRDKLKNKAKTLLWIQENSLGRHCTTALMGQLEFTQELMFMYDTVSSEVFEHLSNKRRYSGKGKTTPTLQKALRRKPDYNQAGLDHAKLYHSQLLENPIQENMDIQTNLGSCENDEVVEIQTDYSMFEISIRDRDYEYEDTENMDNWEIEEDYKVFGEDEHVYDIRKKMLRSSVPTFKETDDEHLQYRVNKVQGDDCDDDVFVVFYTYACENYAANYNKVHGFQDQLIQNNCVPMQNSGIPLSVSFENHFPIEKITSQSNTLNTDTSAIPDQISVDHIDDENIQQHEDEEIIKQITAIAEGIQIPEEIMQYQPPTEFQFSIPQDDVNVMYNFHTNTFQPGAWPIIVDKYLQKEQKACSFNATRGVALLKRENSPYARLYGKCKCNIQFTIDVWRKPVRGESLQCNVKTKGSFNLIQAKKTGRQVRSVARQTMSSVLLHNKPGKIYLQNVHKTSIVRLLHQNNQQQSLETLQRIRHEALNATANHQDPFEDLLSFAKETEAKEQLGTKIKGFVHMRQFDPQNIQLHMYTQTSLQMLNTIKKSRSAIIHFDSTGSVTHSINSKRLLYYLAIVASPEGFNFPLAATLSHRGRSFEISDLFRKVTTDMQTLNPSFKSLAPIVVCDFSLAVINGLLQGVNTMEVMDYLKASYNAITDKQPFAERKSIVFICTSHVIKSFTHLVKKHIPKENKKLRRLCGHAFARLQQSTDLQSYVAATKLICETFGKEYLPREKIAENEDMLQCKDYQESSSDGSDDDFEDLDMFLEDESTRDQSPFSKIFRQIRQKVDDDNQVSQDNYKNDNYIPKVLDLINDYYAPYAPLWTAMLLYKTGRHTHGSITNGVVEHEFNFLKNNFHDEGACKVNIFVRRQYEYFSGKVLSKLSEPTRIRKRPYNRKKADDNSAENRNTDHDASAPQDLNDASSEEVWMKRPKKNLPFYISSHPLPKQDHQELSQITNDNNNVDSVVDMIYEDILTKENNNKAQDISQDSQDFAIDADVEEDMNEISSPCSLNEILTTTGEPLLQKIDILKGYRMALLKLDELAVAKRGSQTIVLKSEDLLDLIEPSQWVTVDVMDVCLNYLKARFPQSNFALTPATFCSKFTTITTQKSEWKNTRRPTTNQQNTLIDDFYDIDFTNEKHILHPLLVSNHWVLLQIDDEKRTCTIYDSLGKSDTRRNDIRKNALPVFLKNKKELGKWTCKYSNKPVRQKDGSSCALHVINAAKILFSGEDYAHQRYENINHPKDFRITLVRELISSTQEGRRMIQKSVNCNETLERELRIFHDKLESKKKETDSRILILLDENKKTTHDASQKNNSCDFTVDDILDKDELAYNRAFSKKMDLFLDGDPYDNLQKDIYASHDKNIQSLKIEKLRIILNEILPDLNQIFSGKVCSTRHEAFLTTGLNKEKLRKIALSLPFKQSQDRAVLDFINKEVAPMLPKTIGTNDVCFYVTLVLLPEALIRVFAKVNNISLQQADKELRLHCGSPDLAAEDFLL